MKLLKPYLSIMLILLSLLTACTDDETWSQSPLDLLTFDSEVIDMDTCFSLVPTPTRTFWVRNNTGKGIRMDNVRLQNGNQTGFRVNVDGTYLGSESGYGMSNLELRHGDSLRVYVELTAPETLKEEPDSIADHLVFSLANGGQQSVLLTAHVWDAIHYDSIIVSDELTLSGSKPILVRDSIVVRPGAELTIDEGTTLYMHAKSKLLVDGSLHIRGTQQNPVTLRCDRLDRMFDYLLYDEVSGQWGGIHLRSGAGECTIQGADVHAAQTALQVDSAVTVVMENSSFHNSKGYGLLSRNGNITARNCLFSNALYDCVSIDGGVADFSYCTMAQFYPLSADRGAALYFTNANWPLLSLNVVNTMITGYADDVLMANQYNPAAKDSTEAERPYEWNFSHCLITTPEVTDEEYLPRLQNIIYEVADEDAGKKDDERVWKDKNFQLVDIDKLKYDFRPSETTRARGAAMPLEGITTDLLGNPRSAEAPTVGCYE